MIASQSSGCPTYDPLTHNTMLTSLALLFSILSVARRNLSDRNAWTNPVLFDWATLFLAKYVSTAAVPSGKLG